MVNQAALSLAFLLLFSFSCVEALKCFVGKQSLLKVVDCEGSCYMGRFPTSGLVLMDCIKIYQPTRCKMHQCFCNFNYCNRLSGHADNSNLQYQGMMYAVQGPPMNDVKK